MRSKSRSVTTATLDWPLSSSTGASPQRELRVREFSARIASTFIGMRVTGWMRVKILVVAKLIAGVVTEFGARAMRGHAPNEQTIIAAMAIQPHIKPLKNIAASISGRAAIKCAYIGLSKFAIGHGVSWLVAASRGAARSQIISIANGAKKC